jgi:hypothetical protein
MLTKVVEAGDNSALEIKVQNVSLSVPFLVLSTEIKITGEVEKHVLTPFGYVDIIFPSCANQNEGSLPSMIQVVGDVDSWMVDESMPDEFRASILGFIGEITRSHCGCPILDSQRVSIGFKGVKRDINVVWEKCCLEDKGGGGTSHSHAT